MLAELLQLATITGILLLAGLPGLLLTVWLLPHASYQRTLPIAGALAVVVLGWVGLLLGYTPGGLTRPALVTVIAGMSAALVVLLTSTQRGGLRLAPPYLAAQQNGRAAWKSRLPRLGALLIFLVFIAALPSMMAVRKESFTEFYIPYADLETVPWRQPSDPSQFVLVPLVIASRERAAETYRVFVMTDGETTDVLDLGVMQPGEVVQRLVTIPPRAQPSQQYELLLYKGQSELPYRRLHFWLSRTLQ